MVFDPSRGSDELLSLSLLENMDSAKEQYVDYIDYNSKLKK
jgi:hypothetical protein